MCGRTFRGYGGLDLAAARRRPWRVRSPRRHSALERRDGASGYFGLGAEEMDPGARISASLALLAPAALVAVLVLALAPQLFWLFFIFGWAVVPAFGMFAGGVADLAERRLAPQRFRPPAQSQERELLDAMREHGELTPARAAVETSLSVKEADRILGELAEGGYLEVRVRGGGIFYALWESAEIVREQEGPAVGTEPRMAHER